MKRILMLCLVAVLSLALSAQDYDILDYLPQMIPIEGESFSVSTTEVTQEVYQAVMGINPSKFKDKERPVEQVSWYEALIFCNKLSEKKGFTPCYSIHGTTDTEKWGEIPNGKNYSDWSSLDCDFNANGFRLCTKEEWLIAARGGAENIFSGANVAAGVAWYKANSDNMTHPVASKQPNAFGLYDMSGNVWEWCYDHTSYYCVDMGGSFYDDARYANIDGRSGSISPSTKVSSLGIRLCQSVR